MSGYFSVSKRNPYHWDIVDKEKRIFCIRGEPGDICIRDERSPAHRGSPITKVTFRTVDAAMAWIASELMQEPTNG